MQEPTKPTSAPEKVARNRRRVGYGGLQAPGWRCKAGSVEAVMDVELIQENKDLRPMIGNCFVTTERAGSVPLT